MLVKMWTNRHILTHLAGVWTTAVTSEHGLNKVENPLKTFAPKVAHNDPATPSIGIKTLKILSSQQTLLEFSITLFMTVTKWKQPKCHSWMKNKNWTLYAMNLGQQQESSIQWIQFSNRKEWSTDTQYKMDANIHSERNTTTTLWLIPFAWSTPKRS